MANIATELYKYYSSFQGEQEVEKRREQRKRSTKRKRASTFNETPNKNAIEVQSKPAETSTDNSAEGKLVASALVEILTNPANVNPVGVGLRFAKRRRKSKKNSDDEDDDDEESEGDKKKKASKKKEPKKKKEKKNDKKKSTKKPRQEPQQEKESVKGKEVIKQPAEVLPNKNQNDETPIWGIDNHLALMSVVTDYMKIYRKHVWPLNPLHPAVFDESNIEYYLITPEGLEEKSSMSLNFNVALMFGCLLTGDLKVTAEFYMQAQHQLDYLCQYTYHTTTDYSIALAVMGLAYYKLYVLAEVFDSAKLISLAMAICKRINAMNSDVYVRCLLSLSLHPMRNYEILKNITQEVENAKDLPYYPLVAVSKTSYPPQHYQNKARTTASLQQQMPVSLQNLKTIASATKVAANVLALLFMTTEVSASTLPYSADNNSLSQSNLSSFGPDASSHLTAMSSPLSPTISLSPTSPDLYLPSSPDLSVSTAMPASPHPPPTSAELSDLSLLLSETGAFEEFLQIVEALAQQIFSVQQSSRDPLPSTVECWFSLLTNALAAKCNLHLGRRSAAFKHALHFLAEARKPKSCYVIFAGDYINFVLEVFVELEKFEYIHELLDAIEPWACLIPSTRKKKEEVMMMYGMGADPIHQVAKEGLGVISKEGDHRKQEELIGQLETEKEKMMKMEEKMHWMEQVMFSLRKDIEKRRNVSQQLEQQLQNTRSTPAVGPTGASPQVAHQQQLLSPPHPQQQNYLTPPQPHPHHQPPAAPLANYNHPHNNMHHTHPHNHNTGHSVPPPSVPHPGHTVQQQQQQQPHPYHHQHTPHHFPPQNYAPHHPYYNIGVQFAFEDEMFLPPEEVFHMPKMA